MLARMRGTRRVGQMVHHGFRNRGRTSQGLRGAISIHSSTSIGGDSLVNKNRTIDHQQQKKGQRLSIHTLHTDDFFEDDGYLLPSKYRRATRIKRYEIGKQLGHGMFATVHEGLDKETGQKVALKIMDKDRVPKDIIDVELQILGELSGKVNRVNPILDVFEDAKHLYFVLELMQGDLFEVVHKKGRMTEVEAAVVIRKLCYTLDALHAHGVLHRDIKLENLLVDEDEFKLADFGFATRIGGKPDRFKNPAGTFGYVSPEVLESRQYTEASDVWSAGIVLYILLAGHPPFPHAPGIDFSKLSIQEQLETELEAIRFGREKKMWHKTLQKGPWKDISVDAKRLVSGMLRLNPQDRFTCKQVLQHPWIVANTKLQQFEFLNFE